MLDHAPSRPPRVLQICAVDFTVYHFLLPLMRAQREWGFEVEAACARGEFAERIEAEGFPVRDVEIARSKNPLRLLQSYRGIKRVLRERTYDVVHLHTPVAALVGRPAARRAGVPLVLYTAHGFYFHEGMKPRTRNLYVGMERWAQRYADFLFSQSDEDRRTAIAEKIEREERTMTIGNGVDTDRFRPDLLSDSERAAVRAEFGIGPNDGPIVTMMGRLVREKGYFEFLDAWAALREEFPKSRALLIGDALPSDHDDSAAQIRARAAELALGDSIIFAGLRKDVPRLLAASDILILPSWREGMPRSIIEAMASGLPVVATDIRGCREEVVEGETGFLAAPREPASLVAPLRTLLGSSDLRRKLGESGRRRAAEHFSEGAVIERQRAVYERLFCEKGLSWPPKKGGA